MRARRRLVAAAVGAVVIVVGGWLMREVMDSEQRQTVTPTPPPTAAPDGFRWVGSGHVVVAVPDGWVADTGCGRPPCNAGEDEEQVSTVTVGFTPDDTVSPQDETVTIDGVAAIRSPVHCDDTGCTGRILVPAEHAVVQVTGATEREVSVLLDGVHVLDEQVAVPETRYAERPVGTDARRFKEWARSLGLAVQYEEVAGEVPGQVVDVQPPTGTMVAVGTTVVARVAGPIPAEPPCEDLRVEVAGQQVYPSTGTVRVTLVKGEKLLWRATGACKDLVALDRSDPSVSTWVVPLCTTLQDAAVATCVAGQARLGSAVITRTG